MAQFFDYVVLTAVPDAGRNERVNVGLIIFKPTEVDIRMPGLSKLRAITGADWERHAEDIRLRIRHRLLDPVTALKEVKSGLPLDPCIRASDVAWFSINDVSEYDASVRALLHDIVLTPQMPRDNKPNRNRINTEIARILKGADVLAPSDEPMETHRVHRNVEIEGRLTADFVQKNGVYRVAATLDLRRSSVSEKDTALKAITLDRARKRYGARKTDLLSVYAPSVVDEDQTESALRLLRNYSDQLFDWSNSDDRERLLSLFYSGAGIRGPLL